MIQLTNYSSGEIVIAASGGESLRLPRGAANRLIMAARMHSVAEFLEKLPSLIPHDTLLARIRETFELKDASAQWNLKERFARLTTLARGYEPQGSEDILEAVTLIQ